MTKYLFYLLAILFGVGCKAPNLRVEPPKKPTDNYDAQIGMFLPTFVPQVQASDKVEKRDEYVLVIREDAQTCHTSAKLHETLAKGIGIAYKLLPTLTREVVFDIKKEIPDSERKKKIGHVVNGYCEFPATTNYYIAMRSQAFGPELVAHEICHAQFKELGISLPQWLEEGFAEYVEFGARDGFSSEWLELVKERDLLSFDQVYCEGRVTTWEEESHLRASAWAYVFYAMQETQDLLCLAEDTDFCRPEQALTYDQLNEAVYRMQAKNMGPQLPTSP